jgi:DNA-binding NtrC family response regulator
VADHPQGIVQFERRANTLGGTKSRKSPKVGCDGFRLNAHRITDIRYIAMASFTQVLWLSDSAHQGWDGAAEYLAELPKASFAVMRCRVRPGLQLLSKMQFDVIGVELPVSGVVAADVVEEVNRVSSGAPIVIFEPQGTTSDAVRLVRLGAYHYLNLASLEQLPQVLREAGEWQRSKPSTIPVAETDFWRRWFIGDSSAMDEVRERIRLVGPRQSTVLIQGETGTGKELIARAIHAASDRAHLPMVAVNCAAIPETLIEAELFGHAKGAFTGAIQPRAGRFEQANRSTIFLDEIAELPMSAQAKLLRLLQEREVQRLGRTETIKLDIRVIAACNQSLEKAVEAHRFREDLYYRVCVVPIKLPPLRDRKSDIPALVQHFVEKICERETLPPKQITPETIERLFTYEWPGNVRELEHAVELAVIMSGDRETLRPADFSKQTPTQFPAPPLIRLPDNGFDLEEAMLTIERSILEQALYRAQGNKSRAAGLLRMKRTTLSSKVRSFALEESDGEVCEIAV